MIEKKNNGPSVLVPLLKYWRKLIINLVMKNYEGFAQKGNWHFSV